jgi:hypothetical protein
LKLQEKPVIPTLSEAKVEESGSFLAQTTLRATLSAGSYVSEEIAIQHKLSSPSFRIACEASGDIRISTARLPSNSRC